MVFLNCVRVQIYTMRILFGRLSCGILLWRFNYNFNENIIFQPLSVRTVLHASKKITVEVLFWSVGANWRISQEKFMQNLTWISNLSAKISYGEQGNDNLLRYDSLEGGYIPIIILGETLSITNIQNANQVGGLDQVLGKQKTFMGKKR